jgi:hypothetical protein
VGTQHVIEELDLQALVDEDGDMLPLPEQWNTMSNGRPQINWVRIVRQSRESH